MDRTEPKLPVVVPLHAGLRKRLYEPIVLLCSLITAYMQRSTIEISEAEAATAKSPAQTYYCFVNKLGQICDSRKGGHTVTAFAVLRPGSVAYVFASNNRDDEARETVRAYITDVLRTIGDAPEQVVKEATPRSPLFSDVLQKILRFNRPRIEAYAKVLACQLDFCIDVISNEDSVDGSNPSPILVDPTKAAANCWVAETASEELRSLKPLLLFALQNPKVNDDECTLISPSTIGIL